MSDLKQRAVDLLLRSICERDDARARELARQSAEAMVDIVYEAWDKRLQTAREALELAEKALIAAETASDPEERRRQEQQFERHMAVVEAAKNNALPDPRMH